MVAAILRPAIFRMFGAQRQFLPIANGRHPVAGYPQCLQIFLGGLRPLGAEGNIVFLRTTVVAMAFDLKVAVRIFLQPVGVAVQYIAILRADSVIIVIKMYIAQRALLVASELALLELAQRTPASATQTLLAERTLVSRLPDLACARWLLRRAAGQQEG